MIRRRRPAARRLQVRERLRTEPPVVIDASIAVAVGIDLIPSAPLLTRAVRLAFELDHALYGCVYLALATRQGARLARADGRLRRSAARVAVPLWRP